MQSIPGRGMFLVGLLNHTMCVSDIPILLIDLRTGADIYMVRNSVFPYDRLIFNHMGQSQSIASIPRSPRCSEPFRRD